ncbi:MAG: hypothetical protein RR922_05720 [Clostridia bacterium]
MEDRLLRYTYREPASEYLNTFVGKRILDIYLEHNFTSSFFVQVRYNKAADEYYVYSTKQELEILKNIQENIASSETLKEKYKKYKYDDAVKVYFKEDEDFKKYINIKKMKRKDGKYIEDVLKKDRLADYIGETYCLNGWRYNLTTSYLGDKRTYSFQCYIDKGYENIGKLIETVFSYLPEKQKEYGTKNIAYRN